MYIDVEFLRRYKLQNPVKYVRKYGDKLPEEVDLALINTGIPTPEPQGPITVELGAPKEVEMEFKEPTPVEEPVEEPKPKVKKQSKTIHHHV